MEKLEQLISDASSMIWGYPLIILLTGGGLFFAFYSRFLPFKYFGHAINILRGKYDRPDDPGQINHFQALSSALAATIGMGNISGVALAIGINGGGPGAIFWMWISALVGICIKFFTCTLAILYRGKDSEGELQGGPMYVIREGLGKKWMPLAIFFSIAGFFGATPVFQTNQMVAVLRDVIFEPLGFQESFGLNLSIGLAIATLATIVIIGGIKRIGLVASRLVPSMVILYMVSVGIILLLNFESILPSLSLIINDVFTAQAALGGAVGAIVLEGTKRAAFSNEAGIGMAPMYHGAAKTNEPVREGLVAMMEPAIDTLVVCTLTGLCIIITGVWTMEESNGIALTALAFGQSLPGIGPYILLLCVITFAITTIFGMAYCGRKCLSFLIGAKRGKWFNYWYIGLIILGSVASLDIVVNLVFVAYGLMAFPTMISAILLAPKVMEEAKRYFSKV